MLAFRALAPMAFAAVLLGASVAAAPADAVPRALAATHAAAADPAGALAHPQAALAPVLDPSTPNEGSAPSPPADATPGFGDRVRAAFQDDMMLAGVTTLMAAGIGLVGFAFVTRYISPKEALKNPQRSMLYGFVRGNPGVHLKKLSEEFGMKTSSILWHVRKLESAQLVRSERANGYRVFYPTEGGVQVKLVSRAGAALQNANARRLYEALEANPGSAAAALAATSGIHPGTVRWHIRKLKEFGLVEELERDGQTLYFGTTLGRSAIAAVGHHTVAPAPAPA